MTRFVLYFCSGQHVRSSQEFANWNGISNVFERCILRFVYWCLQECYNDMVMQINVVSNDEILVNTG